MCGTPAGQPGYLRRDVGTRDAGFGELVPCPDCCETAIANKVSTQLDGILVGKTFDNFRVVNQTGRAGLDAARKFAGNPVGWLTLYGEHGPGKTHLCAAIANKIGLTRARYYNAPDLANSFFGKQNDVVDELQRYPVLILDELDKIHWYTKTGAAWVREQFQRILDHRYRNLRTHGLVLATNKPPGWYDDDLQFIQSRMLDQRFNCVGMTGDNRPFAGDFERGGQFPA